MAEAALTDSDDSNDGEAKSPVAEFFDAIWFNDIQKVSEMLDKGFSVKSVSPFDNMALHYAVLNNRMEVLHLFKERMSDGDIDTIYVNSSDDTICGTPLHTASGEQVPVEVFRQLLKWGANVNAPDAKGEPVLHHLFAHAWQDFEAGFEYEFCDKNDKESANKKGHSYLKKLKILHELGADMNIINKVNGLPALHSWCRAFFWCTEGCLENPETLEWGLSFLQTFLECGADPDVIGERDTSPLVYFAQRRYSSCHTDFIEIYRKMTKLVLSYCKNLHSRDTHGRNLLHIASEFSNYVFLEETLNFNTDVNNKDRFGLTPLHLITHNKNYEERDLVTNSISSLARHGADMNIRDNHGSTPCHHAVHMDTAAALKCLIDLGASLSILDNRGRSPRDLGRIEGTGEIRELLGILYDSSAMPIVKGVSDLRFGWFYPQCCHVDYRDDTKHGVVESPNVYHKNVKDWLDMYPMCNHNAKVILQNSIPSLESNKEQEKMCREDASEIRRSILTVLKAVANSIGSINKLYQSSPVFGGSVSEDTKVGSPDEFDVVFNLENLSEMILIEESVDMSGYVLLKIKDPKIFEEFGLKNIEDGYLKRSEVSKNFHMLFEQCLRKTDVWQHSQFFSDWGTTNAFGEGMNIGQLHLVWYGPTLKRQDISVDIVPVIKIPEWQPSSLRNDVKIIDQGLVRNHGCYLVMKSTTDKEFPLFSFNEEEMNSITSEDEENDSIAVDDKLFRISHSHLEHAIMAQLPQNIKNGYKVAKSIQLQCPSLLFDLSIFGKNLSLPPDYHSKVEVGQCITSYILKTALFHVLHDAGIHSNISITDLQPVNWNTSVIEQTTVQGHVDIKEALEWTSNIYRKILEFCEQDVNMPTYFLSGSEIKSSNSSKTATKEFCYIILRLVKEFPVKDTSVF